MTRTLSLCASLAAFLAATSLASTAAFGQAFKCVDKAGKTTYSSSPCPSGSKTGTIREVIPGTVSAPAAPAPAAAPAAEAAASTEGGAAADGAKAAPAAKASAKAAPAGPKTAAEQEIEFRKRKMASEEAAKKAAEKAGQEKARAENCSSAKASLASLQAGGRQARFNDKGERYMLDDAQIAQETARAQQAVKSSCG